MMSRNNKQKNEMVSKNIFILIRWAVCAYECACLIMIQDDDINGCIVFKS